MDTLPSSEEYTLLRQYREALDEACMIVRIDTEGQTTYVNDLYCQLSGYTREDIIGHPHAGQMDVTPEVSHDITATVRAGRVWRGAVRKIRKNGGYYHVMTTVKPLRNANGEIYEYLAISTDITHIKGLEERKNFFNEHTIVSMTDPQGRIIYVNDNFCRISGYTREELLGNRHNIIRHPDMPDSIFKDLWETITSGKTWHGLVKNRRKDGGHYWVKTTIAPIMDEHGNIIQYLSVRVDVTEYEEAEKNYQGYEDAISASSMIVKMDVEGTITYANNTFISALGYKEYELVGRTYIPSIGVGIGRNFSQIHKDIMSSITEVPSDKFDNLWFTIRSKQVWKGIIKCNRRNGSFLWCATTIAPMLDSNENVFEYVIIQTDVTDIEIAKQYLKKSFDQLQELDRKKNDFLNIASHELRTPMTAVKGYASMILEGDGGEISDESRTYIEQIYKSSHRLIHLINDMLDISKLEAGKMTFFLEEVNICRLIHEITMDMRQIANQKSQNVVEDTHLQKDVICTVDKNKLRQVITNLISNAIKFTPEHGTITVRIAPIADKIGIIIEDTGIGIAQADIPMIFEKFGQVNTSLTRDENGSGLGLPIARLLMREMGGTLTVESEVDHGSVFTVIVPRIQEEYTPLE